MSRHPIFDRAADDPPTLREIMEYQWEHGGINNAKRPARWCAPARGSYYGGRALPGTGDDTGKEDVQGTNRSTKR